jgi:hypothetical protein
MKAVHHIIVSSAATKGFDTINVNRPTESQARWKWRRYCSSAEDHSQAHTLLW